MTLKATPPPLPRPSRRRRFLPWLFVALAGLILASALFYPVENWRGRRAWKNCQRELAARGEILDWTAYIPAHVPDQQNMFKAPKMAEWFVGRETNELVELLDPKNFYDFVRRHGTNTNPAVVAEIKVVASDTNLNLEALDALLHRMGEGIVYTRLLHPSLTNLAGKAGVPPLMANASAPESKIIPLIIMEDVPLTDAITNLAQQANLKYSLDPKINFRQIRSGDHLEGPPNVSISWEDVTPEQALSDLFMHYNLQWLSDPKTGVARVTVRDPTAPRMRGFPSLQEHMGQLIHNALDSGVTAPQGFTLIAGFAQIKPARIFHRSHGPPLSAEQIGEFLPTNSVVSAIPGTDYLDVETERTNLFRVVLDRSRIFTATEFLRWSDLFQRDFDLIRAALKRPYATMDGNYQQPFAVPVPNVKSFRLVAQTVAQRAQCHLLLGQPEEALRELTLVHDMCRLLKTTPSGRPITMVAAMLDTAIAGIYANVIADGLRLHAWREPQLASIQDQLAETTLPPLIAEALRYERAMDCQMMKNILGTAERGSPLVGPETNALQTLFNPSRGLLRLFPRGWFDQNLVTLSLVYQRAIDSLDLTNNLVMVESVKEWGRDMTNRMRFRPYTFFPAILVPNYSRALQTVARNQTMVNQALIACALERYRLKDGQYPATLDGLSPQFIKSLPRDVIGGNTMRYRCIGESSFLLYSIGWDNQDDGGASSTDVAKGDWVWSASTN